MLDKVITPDFVGTFQQLEWWLGGFIILVILIGIASGRKPYGATN